MLQLMLNFNAELVSIIWKGINLILINMFTVVSDVNITNTAVI